MRARNHIIASFGISAGLQTIFNSWPATAGCFFSGILIDLDHYLEYVVHRGKFPFRYQDLVDFCVPYQERKVYLIFHAYEYLIILWLLLAGGSLDLIWLGIAVGLTSHLILDHISNPSKPWFYFLAFRLAHHFEARKLLTDKAFESKRHSNNFL